MGSFIDLTGSSSPIEALNRGKSIAPASKSKDTGPVSAALAYAVNIVDNDLLRMTILNLCKENEMLRSSLEDMWLVKGKHVIRYHEDTESEDEGQDEEEEEEDEDEDEDKDKTAHWKPISIGEEELTSKFERCDNCEELFDVSYNYREACEWHPGDKSVDHGADFWADHDPDCHGDPDSFIDDPSYGEGFVYSCCDRHGDEQSCKVTKHKAAVNIIDKSKPRIRPAAQLLPQVSQPPALTLTPNGKPRKRLRNE